MSTMDFFKLQSKNLHRDFKTKKPVSDEVDRDWLYEYEPKYFAVNNNSLKIIARQKSKRTNKLLANKINSD